MTITSFKDRLINQVSVPEVVRNPDWLPHTFDVSGEELIFVHVPREARTEIRFLFDNHFGVKFAKAALPFGALKSEVENASKAPLHFIFHTSFCGSTLLAKALEISGVATSMKEPAVLINLANRVLASNDQANADRLEVVLRLLERPFAAGEAVITKQSNFANRLVDPVLRARPASRTILLYSDLETYLVSLLKRGMWGRILGRKLFLNLSRWTTLKHGLDTDEILELTDLQVAALAWLMHIHHFDAMAKAFGPRVMLLETDRMIAAPAKTIFAVSNFLGLGISEQGSADIAAGPIFTKHSKFSTRDYSVEERHRETQSIEKANSEELTMVVKWLETLAEHHGVSLRPSS